MLARILAIANQKGGVGKTTTAVNLAAALAEAGRTVLLADMDPQGNATGGVGLDKEAVPRSMRDALANPATARDSVVSTNYEGLRVLPANIDLIGVEGDLYSEEGRGTHLRLALDPFRKEYDYILIDAPPSLGVFTLNCLAAAQAVIIPVQSEYYALEGLSQLIKVIRRVRESVNPTLGISGVVVTMFDRRTNLSHQVAEEIRRYFGELVFSTVIMRSVRLGEAPSFGKPVIHYDTNSTGARCYRALAQEVMQRHET